MISYQKESLKDIWDELFVNFKLHWDETEVYRHNQPFKPNKQAYIRYEEMGLFHTYTARDGKKLIGNFTMYLTESMHTGEKSATEDTMFILKEYRGNRICYNLYSMVEEEMWKLGAKEINLTSKVINKAGGLIERLGYNHVANVYQKSADSALTLKKVINV